MIGASRETITREEDAGIRIFWASKIQRFGQYGTIAGRKNSEMKRTGGTRNISIFLWLVGQIGNHRVGNEKKFRF